MTPTSVLRVLTLSNKKSLPNLLLDLYGRDQTHVPEEAGYAILGRWGLADESRYSKLLIQYKLQTPTFGGGNSRTLYRIKH